MQQVSRFGAAMKTFGKVRLHVDNIKIKNVIHIFIFGINMSVKKIQIQMKTIVSMTYETVDQYLA